MLDRAYLAEAGILMPWSSDARIIEEFRIVKRNIMFQWQATERAVRATELPRVLMVTSSKPREGKTFAAINLALAFSLEENLATVLIDADSVRGDVTRYLKMPSEPGVAEILGGEVSLADALIQTDLPNLVVLPSGTHGPHVPELLTGRGPSLIFAELSRRYPEHIIILDTAPCLASTGAAGLAPLVDQIVFVIEAAHTQQNEVEAAVNMLRGCESISFLLNKTPEASEHFGSYSYYYGPSTGKAEVD